MYSNGLIQSAENDPKFIPWQGANTPTSTPRWVLIKHAPDESLITSAAMRGAERIMEIQTETLGEEEIAAITGYQLPSKLIQWLASNGWQYALSGASRPVVGRVYARLKLAGVKPTAMNAAAETWTFDLSRVG